LYPGHGHRLAVTVEPSDAYADGLAELANVLWRVADCRQRDLVPVTDFRQLVLGADLRRRVPEKPFVPAGEGGLAEEQVLLLVNESALVLDEAFVEA